MKQKYSILMRPGDNTSMWAALMKDLIDHAEHWRGDVVVSIEPSREQRIARVRAWKLARHNRRVLSRGPAPQPPE